MSNQIITLLQKDVLTGDNFQKWKSNFNIVLFSESIRFILTETRTRVPSVGSSRNVNDDFERWNVCNNKAIDYILASMSDTLCTNLETKKIVVEILDSLQESLVYRANRPALSLLVSVRV